MADKKINELIAVAAINQSDVSVLVSGGVDYKFAFSTLLQFLGTNLTVGANISFGTTLPQNTVGKNGDVFINTTMGSFAQKISGTWNIAYTLPYVNSLTDGTVLYGLGMPGTSTGGNNDTYIDTGSGIFYKKAVGTWGQVFSMQTGPQGPQGTAGTNGTNGTNGFTVLNGGTNPSNLSTGVNGDFYINTSNYTFFGAKTAGTWGTGTSLIGLTGDKGDTGPAGATGPKGDKGDTGDTGPEGTNGAKGDTGDTGPTGTTGPKGDKGDTGDTGPEGTDGASGATGPQGAKGDTGPTGADGDSAYQAWLDLGHTGTEATFIASLVGATGATGATGPTGATGATGPTGATGATGADGSTKISYNFYQSIL